MKRELGENPKRYRRCMRCSKAFDESQPLKKREGKLCTMGEKPINGASQNTCMRFSFVRDVRMSELQQPGNTAVVIYFNRLGFFIWPWLIRRKVGKKQQRFY